MNKLTLVVTVISLVLVIFTCGCQEQTQSSTKRDRLVGAENIRLEKELELCAKETEKQIELLEQCQQEKAKIQQDIDSSVKFLMDLHTKAAKENESLKASIAELESQEAAR